MKTCSSIAAFSVALFIAIPATADPLAQYLWAKRPVVVFADAPNDPRYIRQIELFGEDVDMLEERDIIVLTDTNAAEPSELRKKLRPRGFQLTVIGKDGKVKLRKPRPWTVRELSRVIDKMPLRQQELGQRWQR